MSCNGSGRSNGPADIDPHPGSTPSFVDKDGVLFSLTTESARWWPLFLDGTIAANWLMVAVHTAFLQVKIGLPESFSEKFGIVGEFSQDSGHPRELPLRRAGWLRGVAGHNLFARQEFPSRG